MQMRRINYDCFLKGNRAGRRGRPLPPAPPRPRGGRCPAAAAAADCLGRPLRGAGGLAAGRGHTGRGRGPKGAGLNLRAGLRGAGLGGGRG